MYEMKEMPTSNTSPREIFVDGVKVGEVSYSKTKYWHAALTAKCDSGAWNLLQGFGPTPENAVEAALTKGIEDQREILAAAIRLASAIRKPK